MSGRIVIVGYRPKPGCEDRLRELVAGHLDVLRAKGLATDREAVVMRAEDGTHLEVFEWMSRAAIERAHDDPDVTALWSAFADVCDFIPAGEVAELGELFSEFAAINPNNR
ncbi:MAG: hypothetical protein AAGE01_02805 [Pseudomonadota bacterium]